MTESEVRLAILIVAVVIIGSVLAIAGCIAMSTKWSRQEEKEKNDELLETSHAGDEKYHGRKQT